MVTSQSQTGRSERYGIKEWLEVCFGSVNGEAGAGVGVSKSQAEIPGCGEGVQEVMDSGGTAGCGCGQSPDQCSHDNGGFQRSGVEFDKQYDRKRNSSK